MKRSTFHLATAFCGAATGILMGRMATVDPRPSVPLNEVSAARDRPDRRGHASESDAAGKHDFASLLKMQQQGRLDDSPVSRDLERLSAGKLRELLLELKDKPDAEEDPDSGTILQALAQELYRREGMDSIPWAESMEKGAFRAYLMWNLIGEAALESPVKSKPWIDRFLSENGEGAMNDFRWKLMSGAQARGAEDVVELEMLFGEHFSTILKPAIPYPDSFDYHKLFTGIPPADDMRHNASMQYWAYTDKEAAWKGILDTVELHGRNGALYYGALFSAAGGFDEDPAARHWALKKLDEMPDSFRADAVKSLADLGRLEPSTTAALMKDLPRESDRVALVSAIISPRADNEKLLPTIRALGSEISIQAALLTAAYDNRIGSEALETTHGRQTVEKFNQLMEDLDLSPEAMAEVNAALKMKR